VVSTDLYGVLFGSSITQWLEWKCRGGGTVISDFGPLLVVVGPLLTVLDHFAPVDDQF